MQKQFGFEVGLINTETVRVCFGQIDCAVYQYFRNVADPAAVAPMPFLVHSHFSQSPTHDYADFVRLDRRETHGFRKEGNGDASFNKWGAYHQYTARSDFPATFADLANNNFSHLIDASPCAASIIQSLLRDTAFKKTALSSGASEFPSAPALQILSDKGLKEELLVSALRTVLGNATVSFDSPLSDVGISSHHIVEVSARIERESGQRVPATMFYDCMTLRDIHESMTRKNADVIAAGNVNEIQSVRQNLRTHRSYFVKMLGGSRDIHKWKPLPIKTCCVRSHASGQVQWRARDVPKSPASSVKMRHLMVAFESMLSISSRRCHSETFPVRHAVTMAPPATTVSALASSTQGRYHTRMCSAICPQAVTCDYERFHDRKACMLIARAADVAGSMGAKRKSYSFETVDTVYVSKLNRCESEGQFDPRGPHLLLNHASSKSSIYYVCGGVRNNASYHTSVDFQFFFPTEDVFIFNAAYIGLQNALSSEEVRQLGFCFTTKLASLDPANMIMCGLSAGAEVLYQVVDVMERCVGAIRGFVEFDVRRLGPQCYVSARQFALTRQPTIWSERTTRDGFDTHFCEGPRRKFVARSHHLIAGLTLNLRLQQGTYSEFSFMMVDEQISSRRALFTVPDEMIRTASPGHYHIVFSQYWDIAQRLKVVCSE